LDNQLTIPHAAIVWLLPDEAEPPMAKYLLFKAAQTICSAHGWRIINFSGKSLWFHSSSQTRQK
jgi:hypothetical protein